MHRYALKINEKAIQSLILLKSEYLESVPELGRSGTFCKSSTGIIRICNQNSEENGTQFKNSFRELRFRILCFVTTWIWDSDPG
jgi:hypothetical protein